MKLSALPTAVVITAFALGAVGCGGGGDGAETETEATSGETGTTAPEETTTKSTTSEKKSVGSVTNLEELQLFIDEVATDKHIDLFEDDVLRTDATGLVWFRLDSGAECQMTGDTELQVLPASGVVISFVDGTSWCSKAPGESQQEYEAPGTKILVEDPVFSVTVDEDETVVRVTYGSVDLAVASGERLKVLPEKQGVIARQTGGVRLEAINLTGRDLAAAKVLQARQPRIEAGRPVPGDSRALGEIFEKSSLTVAVYPPDPEASAFAEDFTASLSRSWGVEAQVTQASSDEAASGLAEGLFDIVLARDDVGLAAEVSSVPLFQDRAGQTWQLNLPADDRFARALQDFVSADVLSGQYAKRYKAAFTTSVRYEPVQRIAAR